MRLVLHIGSTKTGSSALQATLFERREALAEAGALYSAHGVAASAHHLLAAAIHPGAWRMHAGDLPDDRARYFADSASAILEEAAAINAHTIVISSEYFWGALPSDLYKAFARAFQSCDIEILAFLRRQDAWSVSSYLQAVKSGEARPFEIWYEAALNRRTSGFHYFRVINRWAHYTDAKAVHVLRYEDTKDNVFKAFCETAKIDVDTEVAMRRVNPSPSREGVQLLLEVNRSDASPDEKAAERKAIMMAHRGEGPSAYDVSEPMRAAILRDAQLSDQLILREFLKREGPLFPPDPSPQAAEPTPPAPQALGPSQGATPAQQSTR